MPGIALAQELEESGCDVVLVTSGKTVDLRLREQYERLRYYTLPGCGFSWRPFRFLRFGWNFSHAFFRSLRMLLRERVSLVFAFGGFISVSVCLAAKLLRRPVFIHEANQVMGRANRFLSHCADRVYVPEALKKQEDCRRKKFFEAGYPLRRDFVPLARDVARDRLGLAREGKVLLVTGGSQGAAALVQWARDWEPFLLEEGISLVCLTGPDGLSLEKKEVLPDGRSVVARYQQFSDVMPLLFSAADLMVCRAGMGTIAEAIHSHLPTILVPYPFSRGDHQQKNGEALAAIGGAQVIQQESLGELFPKLIQWMKDDALLAQMRKNLELIDLTNSRKQLAGDVVHFLKNNDQHDL